MNKNELKRLICEEINFSKINQFKNQASQLDKTISKLKESFLLDKSLPEDDWQSAINFFEKLSDSMRQVMYYVHTIDNLYDKGD